MDETDKNCTPITHDVIPMLEYEKKMFLNVVENDALMVCAKGLNDYVVILNLLRAHNDSSNLVLVINSSDLEEKYFIDKLKLNVLPLTSAEREKTYLSGGIYFVSTRILVVDLLKNRVPVEHVTGIVVLRAHGILESCQEAFALRLYRQKNKVGFVKAFSHSSERFTFGFAHVEKVMRSLFVKELFLWPRFHGAVIECLKTRQPIVVELHVPLTHKTTLIQTCLLDIMNYTTKELKKINRTLDLHEITVENCITKKFHKILQSQLDTVWHQLSTRTKDLIQDLKIMRTLIIDLIHRDSVAFYADVSKYRTADYAKINSGWILLDSADQLFKYSRSRVFNSNKEFEPELCSKWKYLSEILTVDIPEDKKKQELKRTIPIKILILCDGTRTCSQLNQYLTLGTQKFMYLSARRHEIDLNNVANEYATLKNSLILNVPKNDLNNIDIQQQNVSIRKADSDKQNNSDDLDKFIHDDFEIEDTNEANFTLTMTQALIEQIASKGQSSSGNEKDESIFESFTQMENMDLTQLDTQNPLIYIRTFKNNEGGICLEDALRALQPNYVVMYHSNVTATRQIELYEARKDPATAPLKVYFLMHAQTTEEQAYLTALRREKQSFEHLIQAKSTMVIPTYQDGKSELPSNLERDESVKSELNTRKAGGQEVDLSLIEKPRVIVDMREFRSDLPALLHKKGIETDPVTITIGDYILTPEICVERKSLSDLIGSLNSGRLYTQCIQMSRNYARPMLLIEFDQNRPFQLQGHYVVSNDISGAQVQQKLQLLTLHFPRLKLIWSPSPYATAELFFELKQGRLQPNTANAIALGEEASVDGLLSERFNPRIHDFVLKLPGVNSKNIARILNKGISMDDLVKLKKNEIQDMLGNKIDGDMLWNILHSQYKPSDCTADNKNIKKNRFGKPIRGKRF